jgi:periplasmic protein TonB
MFDTLLESRSRSERNTAGAIVSITAHSAVIAIAILATAQARLPSAKSSDVVHTVFFPPQPLVPTTPSRAGREKSAGDRLPPPIDIKRIDVILPPIGVGAVPVSPVDFPSSSSQASTGQDRNATGSSLGAPFQADQVEKQVAFIQGSASPRYPDALRSSGIEGRVIAQFVVDATGRAETDSVRFLRSDNPLFEDAVRAALPRMRFAAAEIGGRKVRQLVQMPFVFTIGR